MRRNIKGKQYVSDLGSQTLKSMWKNGVIRQ